MSEGAPLPDIKSRGLGGFFRDVMREMKHVSWPTRGEAFRLTGVVLGVCVMLALALLALSYIIELLLGALGIGGK